MNRQVDQDQSPSMELSEEPHGEGVPEKSRDVSVCYYGAHLASSMKKFELSLHDRQTCCFTLGTAQVVPGLDMGLRYFRPGAKRQYPQTLV